MGSQEVNTNMQTLLVFVLVAAVSCQEEEAPLAALSSSIPGSPGEDYPIYSSPPDTSFLCDGFIEGYYADPEAECQAFHICANFGSDDLTKYSFLCPNGTLFNQQYFICDWWFNVDCSQAENFYSLNEEVAAAATVAGAGGDGAASDDLTSYTSPESDAADLVAGVLPPEQGAGKVGRRGGKANKFNLRG